MPPRQIWLFQLGCWVAFATAVVHLAEHVSGLNALDPVIVTHINAARPTYVIPIPGVHQPTFLSVLNGFSLSVSLLLATIGAAGLVVLKYGAGQALLLRGVSRAFGFGLGMLVVLSIEGFFSVQTFFMVVAALCFALSGVSREG